MKHPFPPFDIEALVAARADAPAVARTEVSEAVRTGAAEVVAPGRRRPRTRWLNPAQREELALALVLTICISFFPRWRVFGQLWVRNVAGLKVLPSGWYLGILFLVAGLVLALSAPQNSGLRLGSIRDHWKKVLLVCGGAVLVTAVVYPQLPVRPFNGRSATMWVTSPAAQELIFLGYLYGRLERVFPGYVHAHIPVAKALVLTSLFFGFWHAPGLFYFPVGYALFQLFYTGVLGMIPGLSRQWTGSIYYAVLTHSAVNFIAWYAS